MFISVLVNIKDVAVIFFRHSSIQHHIKFFFRKAVIYAYTKEFRAKFWTGYLLCSSLNGLRGIGYVRPEYDDIAFKNVIMFNSIKLQIVYSFLSSNR